jgi:hypothetical protein
MTYWDVAYPRQSARPEARQFVHPDASRGGRPEGD